VVVVSEIEAAAYDRRRLLAALLGRPAPPPGLLGPLVGGLVVTALLVGAEAVRHLW
jgi:hypothetical protein